MEENIRKELDALVDTDYKTRLMNGYPSEARTVIGVPFSTLREFSREFIVRKDWKNVVDTQLGDDTFEGMLLQALITGAAKNSCSETLKWFANYLPKIDSRQLCDASCLAFHTAIDHPEETLLFIRPYLDHAEGFLQRFAIITLLDYFVTTDYIDRTLQFYATVRPATRIAQDALSWAYEVCFLAFQQKTVYALRESTLSYNYFNSIIDRILKSPRISEPQRKIAEDLRR
jgi:hypothetical protein